GRWVRAGLAAVRGQPGRRAHRAARRRRKPWRRIRLWNTDDGWLAASALSAEPFPPPATATPSPSPTPGPPEPPAMRPPHVPEPLRARGSATMVSPLTSAPDDDAAIGRVTAGSAV